MGGFHSKEDARVRVLDHLIPHAARAHRALQLEAQQEVAAGVPRGPGTAQERSWQAFLYWEALIRERVHIGTRICCMERWERNVPKMPAPTQRPGEAQETHAEDTSSEAPTTPPAAGSQAGFGTGSQRGAGRRGAARAVPSVSSDEMSVPLLGHRSP